MCYYLGIDIGTSSVKTILIGDASLKPVAYGRASYDLNTTADGWAEQSPFDWWRATIEAILAVMRDSGVPSERVAGIGLSGQMHTLVVLDKNGEPVRPAISWADQRSVPQCLEIEERMDSGELARITGLIPAAGFTLPKILWVMQNEPEAYERMQKMLWPKDYIRFQLTGTYATDETDASGSLMFDIQKRQWSQEVLEIFHISKELLPPVSHSTQVVGNLTRSAASATGLKPGIPVVAGAGDAESAAIGLGMVRPGNVSITVGTGGQVFTVLDTPRIDSRGRVHTLCHAAPDTWHLMGAILSAGLSLRWLERLFSQDGAGDGTDGGLDGNQMLGQMLQEASGIRAGSDGVIFLPYLVGERSPHMDPWARGGVLRP